MKDGIKEYQVQGGGADPNVMLTASAKGMFQDLDTKGEPFAPYQFV